MWIIYSKISGIVASAINEPYEGHLLKTLDGLDDFEWDAAFIENFPETVGVADCRYFDGKLCILEPEYIDLNIIGSKKNEDGVVNVLAEQVITLHAVFRNGWGKPKLATGTLTWTNSRGLVRPKKAKVSNKTDAFATLNTPNENIKMGVNCSLPGFKPGSLFIVIN
jgi:hypothetical protein